MSVYRGAGVFVAGVAWVFAWVTILMALAGDAGAPFGVALVTCAVFFSSTLAVAVDLVAWATGEGTR